MALSSLYARERVLPCVFERLTQPPHHPSPPFLQLYGDSQAQKEAEALAHHRSLRRSVALALRALAPEERQFLRMKYGLDDGKAKTTRCVLRSTTHL